MSCGNESGFTVQTPSRPASLREAENTRRSSGFSRSVGHLPFTRSQLVSAAVINAIILRSSHLAAALLVLPTPASPTPPASPPMPPSFPPPPPPVVKLGNMYPLTRSGWTVESFSAFRLAIAQVNNRSDLLAGHTLDFTVHDTGGQAPSALQSAVVQLRDPQVVGLCGTGYSRAFEPAAMFASVSGKPIASPGAGSPAFVGKAPYPYALRTTDTVVTNRVIGLVQSPRLTQCTRSHCALFSLTAHIVHAYSPCIRALASLSSRCGSATYSVHSSH
jgi:hypothetical protein